MRKAFPVLIIFMIFFVSCTGLKTSSTGLENQAFLEFIGKPSKYASGITVNVDKEITFKAKVKKDHVTRPKGKAYAISTGVHTISVIYHNNMIYKKRIFISAQETKRIILP